MRILCSVGGLDIAGLCGVFLGGAKYHMPIVADGVIMVRWQQLTAGGFVRELILSFHPTREREPPWNFLMRHFPGPVLDAGLALGEGTGAVMMFSLLDIAMSLYETGDYFWRF